MEVYNAIRIWHIRTYQAATVLTPSEIRLAILDTVHFRIVLICANFRFLLANLTIRCDLEIFTYNPSMTVMSAIQV